MRRLVVTTLLAVCLAIPAAAFAVAGGTDDGTLAVRNGVGKVGLDFDGSALGRVAGHGSVKIVYPFASDGSGVNVFGCDDLFQTDTKTVCSSDGKGLPVRFRAIGGTYKVVVGGSGIYLSAVGNGSVTLNGAGDNPDVAFDGKYSINDEPYKSLPDYTRQYPLETPAGG
jgi:hypothetical protein